MNHGQVSPWPLDLCIEALLAFVTRVSPSHEPCALSELFSHFACEIRAGNTDKSQICYGPPALAGHGTSKARSPWCLSSPDSAARPRRARLLVSHDVWLQRHRHLCFSMD